VRRQNRGRSPGDRVRRRAAGWRDRRRRIFSRSHELELVDIVEHIDVFDLVDVVGIVDLVGVLRIVGLVRVVCVVRVLERRRSRRGGHIDWDGAGDRESPIARRRRDGTLLERLFRAHDQQARQDQRHDDDAGDEHGEHLLDWTVFHRVGRVVRLLDRVE
jgi:hypothetical protein